MTNPSTPNDTEQVSLQDILVNVFSDAGYLLNSEGVQAIEKALTALTLWHKQQAYKEMLEIIGENTHNDYDYEANRFRAELRAAIKVKYNSSEDGSV